MNPVPRTGVILSSRNVEEEAKYLVKVHNFDFFVDFVVDLEV